MKRHFGLVCLFYVILHVNSVNLKQIVLKVCSKNDSSLDIKSDSDVICISKENIHKDAKLLKEELLMKCISKGFNKKRLIYLCNLPSNISINHLIQNAPLSKTGKYFILNQLLTSFKLGSTSLWLPNFQHKNIKMEPPTSHLLVIRIWIPENSKESSFSTSRRKNNALPMQDMIEPIYYPRSIRYIRPEIYRQQPWQSITTTETSIQRSKSNGSFVDFKTLLFMIPTTPVILRKPINWTALMSAKKNLESTASILDRTIQVATMKPTDTTPISATSLSNAMISWKTWYDWQIDCMKTKTNNSINLPIDISTFKLFVTQQSNEDNDGLITEQKSAKRYYLNPLSYRDFNPNPRILLNQCAKQTSLARCYFLNNVLSQLKNRFPKSSKLRKIRLPKPTIKPTLVSTTNKLIFFIKTLYNNTLLTESTTVNPLTAYVNLQNIHFSNVTLTTRTTPNILDYIFPNQLKLETDIDTISEVVTETRQYNITVTTAPLLIDSISALFTTTSTPNNDTSKPNLTESSATATTEFFFDISDIFNRLPITTQPTTHNYLEDSVNWGSLMDPENVTEVVGKFWYYKTKPITESTTSILDRTVPSFFWKSLYETTAINNVSFLDANSINSMNSNHVSVPRSLRYKHSVNSLYDSNNASWLQGDYNTTEHLRYSTKRSKKKLKNKKPSSRNSVTNSTTVNAIQKNGAKYFVNKRVIKLTTRSKRSAMDHSNESVRSGQVRHYTQFQKFLSLFEKCCFESIAPEITVSDNAFSTTVQNFKLPSLEYTNSSDTLQFDVTNATETQVLSSRQTDSVSNWILPFYTDRKLTTWKSIPVEHETNVNSSNFRDKHMISSDLFKDLNSYLTKNDVHEKKTNSNSLQGGTVKNVFINIFITLLPITKVNQSFGVNVAQNSLRKDKESNLKQESYTTPQSTADRFVVNAKTILNFLIIKLFLTDLNRRSLASEITTHAFNSTVKYSKLLASPETTEPVTSSSRWFNIYSKIAEKIYNTSSSSSITTDVTTTTTSTVLPETSTVIYEKLDATSGTFTTYDLFLTLSTNQDTFKNEKITISSLFENESSETTSSTTPKLLLSDNIESVEPIESRESTTLLNNKPPDLNVPQDYYNVYVTNVFPKENPSTIATVLNPDYETVTYSSTFESVKDTSKFSTNSSTFYTTSDSLDWELSTKSQETFNPNKVVTDIGDKKFDWMITFPPTRFEDSPNTSIHKTTSKSLEYIDDYVNSQWISTTTTSTLMSTEYSTIVHLTENSRNNLDTDWPIVNSKVTSPTKTYSQHSMTPVHGMDVYNDYSNILGTNTNNDSSIDVLLKISISKSITTKTPQKLRSKPYHSSNSRRSRVHLTKRSKHSTTKAWVITEPIPVWLTARYSEILPTKAKRRRIYRPKRPRSRWIQVNKSKSKPVWVSVPKKRPSYKETRIKRKNSFRKAATKKTSVSLLKILLILILI